MPPVSIILTVIAVTLAIWVIVQTVEDYLDR